MKEIIIIIFTRFQEKKNTSFFLNKQIKISENKTKQITFMTAATAAALNCEPVTSWCAEGANPGASTGCWGTAPGANCSPVAPISSNMGQLLPWNYYYYGPPRSDVSCNAHLAQLSLETEWDIKRAQDMARNRTAYFA